MRYIVSRVLAGLAAVVVGAAQATIDIPVTDWRAEQGQCPRWWYRRPRADPSA